MPIIETTASAKEPNGNSEKNLQRILNIELTVAATLAEKTLTIGEVLNWKLGSVIEFAKPINSSFDIIINDKKIAEGNAVKIGENFGIQISKVQNIQETVKALKE